MAAIDAVGYVEKTAKKLRLNILSMSQILSLIHICLASSMGTDKRTELEALADAILESMK